jgi:hypothetical protein
MFRTESVKEVMEKFSSSYNLTKCSSYGFWNRYLFTITKIDSRNFPHTEQTEPAKLFTSGMSYRTAIGEVT